ncbi:MAG: hypothetical protein ACI9OJ_004283 [Myxococcota bacterium]|jgi:hypothetical protein
MSRYALLVIGLLMAPAVTHASEVTEVGIVGAWAGHIRTLDGVAPIEEAIAMTFRADGTVLFTAPATTNKTSLFYRVRDNRIELRNEKKGDAKLTITVDYLSPDELSGILTYGRKPAKKPGSAIRVSLKRTR